MTDWAPLMGSQNDDPVPGDPHVVDMLQKQFGLIATEAKDSTASMTALDLNIGWTGDASVKFFASLDTLRTGLPKMELSFADAAAALSVYEGDLQSAQELALQALQKAIDAEQQIRRAQDGKTLAPAGGVGAGVAAVAVGDGIKWLRLETEGRDLMVQAQALKDQAIADQETAAQSCISRIQRAMDEGQLPARGTGTGTGLFGLFGAMGSWFTAAMGALGKQAEWVNTSGRAQIDALLNSSPADQVAWWNALTPAQRAALLILSPTTLLQLKGLPADVRAEADQNYLNTQRSTIALGEQTTEVHADGSVDVKYFSLDLGVNGQVVTTLFADGHCEVKIAGGVNAGVGPPDLPGWLSASAGPEGGLSTTYSFSSPDAANQFIQGLAKAATPSVSVSGWDAAIGFLNPIAGIAVIGGTTAANTATNIENYLSGYSGQQTAVVVHGGLSGSVNLGAQDPNSAGVSLSGTADVSYDVKTHQTTASLGIDGNATANFQPFQGAAAGSAKIAVTWDGNNQNQIKEITITGKYDAEAGAGPPGITALKGTSGTFTMKVDLTDPANRALAMRVLSGTSNPDVVGTAQALAQLGDRSEIVVQTGNATHSGQPVTIPGPIGGDIGSTTTDITETSTWVKPPSGDFTQLNP